EQAAPTNVADLLNSRVPGVQVLSSGGTTGTGSRVRIRGSSSLSLTNEPIVIVDGIRVDNGATGVLRASSIGIGGQAPSRLNAVKSFNPLEVYSPFQTGSRQHYGLSASGGNDQTTFFTSGDFEREKGVYRPNDLRNVSLRANLRHQASRLLDLGINVGYVSSDLGLPQNDNNSAGIASSGLLGFADSSINHGYGFLTPSQAF